MSMALLLSKEWTKFQNFFSAMRCRVILLRTSGNLPGYLTSNLSERRGTKSVNKFMRRFSKDFTVLKEFAVDAPQKRLLTSMLSSIMLCDPGSGSSNKYNPGNRNEPPKRQSGGGSDGDDKNNMNNLLFKALLWMITARLMLTPRRISGVVALFVGYMFIAFLSVVFPSKSQSPESMRYISWNEFMHQMLSHGEVDHVVVHPDLDLVTVVLHEGAVIKGKRSDGKIYHMNVPDVAGFEARLREAEAKLGVSQDSGIQVVYDRSSDTNIVRFLVAIAMIGMLAIILSSALGGRSGGAAASSKFRTGFDPFGGLSRAKFTIVDPLTGEGRGVKFSDVAGLKEAKQEIMEFVDYLRRPNFYSSLGAKVPRGALLLGPPGCGKTMLAKAVATEASVPFFAMNGSEFIEMIGGLGAARVRDLFKEAKKRTPCIVFIDEIDAVGRKRSSGGAGGFDGSTGEGEQTLNQLLVEMDGMGTVGGILVIGATNRADILDRALLRPGRFDRHINIDLPNLIEREEIFQSHLRNVVLEKPPETYARRLASLTPGFTGADIANVVNEGALHAAREKGKFVASEDLEYAIERVVGGMEKKSSALSLEDRRVVAYHESGHALLGWLLEHTDALLKVTIVPRTQTALGFARYDTTEKRLLSKEELFDRMCMALGGRAAELLVFDRATTGAQDDLEKVTKMAYAQVRKYGLSPAVGPISFPDTDEDSRLGRRPYSKFLANLIDAESKKLVTKAFLKTQEIMNGNREKLELLAEHLLTQEVLNYDDVESLIGPPKYPKKRLLEPSEFEMDLQREAGGSSSEPSEDSRTSDDKT
ncbi:unnamed protein product [Notodromas monacha]|uniref:AAA+ ATPase domain-containing protein n=1 Tax=Notodromas monacha TaxID=399045 RepID=A0A7R9BSW2_9CRUS|nr:unnamed protein product [Notodromas monacha]CAG0921127.1 unnamed protein product [Notodromas monacha]